MKDGLHLAIKSYLVLFYIASMHTLAGFLSSVKVLLQDSLTFMQQYIYSKDLWPDSCKNRARLFCQPLCFYFVYFFACMLFVSLWYTILSLVFRGSVRDSVPHFYVSCLLNRPSLHASCINPCMMLTSTRVTTCM